MPSREALSRIKAATVAIAKWRGFTANARHPFSIIGTGFCIDPSGILVTCRHVFDAFMPKTTLELIAAAATGVKNADGGVLLPPVALQQVQVVFYRPLPNNQLGVILAPVTHATVKTDHDLALLRINNDKGVFPDGHPTIPLAVPEEVSEGDEIGTCGFPLGEALHDELGTLTSSFTKGIVSSIIPGAGIDRRLITGFQLDLGATGGNSGGPVFLWDTGRVFGVLESGVVHLTKAAALHQIEADALPMLKQAAPGQLPGRPVVERGTA